MRNDERFLTHAQLAELAAPLQQHLRDEHGAELGGFEAQALLQFVASRIGPLIYNRALADARSALDERMALLQEALWELERD